MKTHAHRFFLMCSYPSISGWTIQDRVKPDLVEFWWSAFCLQWLAIAWAVVVGRE